MTRRIHETRFRYACLEQAQEPDFIPAGSATLDILTHLPPYRPIMLRSHDVRCYACRQLIEQGHTAFTATDHPIAAPVLCYRCGVAWETFCRRLTYDQAAEIPTFGGPKP